MHVKNFKNFPKKKKDEKRQYARKQNRNLSEKEIFLKTCNVLSMCKNYFNLKRERVLLGVK